MILIWKGSIPNIPDGYVLCDGTQNTPDLRDHFVYGAGGNVNPGHVGGSATHTHLFTSVGHDHEFTGADKLAAGTDFPHELTIEDDSGTTNPGSTMPVYHALAFIMKT